MLMVGTHTRRSVLVYFPVRFISGEEKPPAYNVKNITGFIENEGTS